MKKEIMINSTSGETRIAILEDGELIELYVERPENERMVGDIYRGKVSNVVEAIRAAFIDIGLEQNGFLAFDDVGKEISALAERVEKDEETKPGRSVKRPSRSKVILKPGQEVLVQVTKEPIGSKGARLTTAISLPGRYMVLVPHDESIGVSRKIQDIRERKRLRRLAKSMQPEGFGLIIRTVAVGKEVQYLKADMEQLLKNWKRIQEKQKSVKGPTLIYKDLGITSSVIRDLFSPDIDRLVVDSRKLYSTIKRYLKEVSPNLQSKLEMHNGKLPIFDTHRIEEEITKSLSRKIWMKSGGYIIFDQTEALVVVDVNSGRSMSGRNQEANALKTDLEAAREIARQLRLRDIGGIIVIDFIDLSSEKNRNRLLGELRKELKRDRAAFDILPMNNFGLISLTRERIRPSLLYQYSEACPRCGGIGRIPSKSSIMTKIEREIQKVRTKTGERRLVLRVHPDVAMYLTDGIKSRARRLMMKFFVTIKVVPDPTLTDENFEITARKETGKE